MFWLATNLFPGTTVGFDAVDVVRESKAAYIHYMCVSEASAGQPITVRIENAEGKTVATATAVTEVSEMDTYNTLRAEFDKPLPVGVYNAYLDFGGDAKSEKACQLGWFGIGE